MRFLPLLLVVLSGCALIDAATQEKPNARQQAAMGGIFGQIGTAAAVIDDPSTAGADNLADLVNFRHYAQLVEPSVSAKAKAKAARPEGPPACITVGEAGERTLDCEIPLPDGRRCQLTGSMTRAVSDSGTQYAGSLALGGSETCPTGSLDFDVYLEGPTDAPTVADGSLAFRYEDPAGDFFSGTGVVNRIATGMCEVPSEGDLTVTVKGVVDHEEIDSRLTVSFHADPACGVTLIE